MDGKAGKGSIGISFGGGLTGKQWLPLGADGNVAPEHTGGICRNNMRACHMQGTLLVLTAAGLCLVAGSAGQAWAAADSANVKVSTQSSDTATTKPEATATSEADQLIDRGAASPRELLENAHKVLGSGEVRLIDVLGFCQPTYARAMNTSWDAAQRLSAKAKELARVIGDKMGREHIADVVVFGSSIEILGPAGVTSPLANIAKDGKIDWDKIKITQTADKATVEVDGKPLSISLMNVKGKWYMAPPGAANPIELMGMVAAMNATYEKIFKALDQIEQKVKSGEFTKDNLEEESSKIIRQAYDMAGGPGGGKPGPGQGGN